MCHNKKGRTWTVSQPKKMLELYVQNAWFFLSYAYDFVSFFLNEIKCDACCWRVKKNMIQRICFCRGVLKQCHRLTLSWHTEDLFRKISNCTNKWNERHMQIWCKPAFVKLIGIWILIYFHSDFVRTFSPLFMSTIIEPKENRISIWSNQNILTCTWRESIFWQQIFRCRDNFQLKFF